MDERTLLLQEVQIALEAVHAGIDAITNRPDAAPLQCELAMLQGLVNRAIDALEALQKVFSA